MIPLVKKAYPPFPNSFSAPDVSKIVRESMLDDTAKAIRDGILALMTPVIISVEGPLSRNYQMNTSCSSHL